MSRLHSDHSGGHQRIASARHALELIPKRPGVAPGVSDTTTRLPSLSLKHSCVSQNVPYHASQHMPVKSAHQRHWTICTRFNDKLSLHPGMKSQASHVALTRDSQEEIWSCALSPFIMVEHAVL